jgi:hypothetical protein
MSLSAIERLRYEWFFRSDALHPEAEDLLSILARCIIELEDRLAEIEDRLSETELP